MPKVVNLSGQLFGRLKVIQKSADTGYRESRWLCLCDCGNKKIIVGYNLSSGRTRSCGCLQKEKLIGSHVKHGHKRRGRTSKVYSKWGDIIQRCANSNDTRYKNYGGRGIQVCQRWMKFNHFLEDMGEPPTKNHSIDRIDNDGNYCPENCRWATMKQQARNKRNNHMKTFNDRTQCLAAWAEEVGMSPATLWYRVNRGWSIEKALTTPIRRCKNTT